MYLKSDLACRIGLKKKKKVVIPPCRSQSSRVMCHRVERYTVLGTFGLQNVYTLSSKKYSRLQ